MSDTPDTSRRLKAFYIGPRIIATYLSQGSRPIHGEPDRYLIPHLDGLPEGYQIVGVTFDYSRHAFCFAVQHDSFDEVPVHQTLPDITVMMNFLLLVPKTPPALIDETTTESNLA